NRQADGARDTRFAGLQRLAPRERLLSLMFAKRARQNSSKRGCRRGIVRGRDDVPDVLPADEQFPEPAEVKSRTKAERNKRLKLTEDAILVFSSFKVLVGGPGA